MLIHILGLKTYESSIICNVILISTHVDLTVPVFEREARGKYPYSSCYVESEGAKRDRASCCSSTSDNEMCVEVRDMIVVVSALRARTLRTPRLVHRTQSEDS